MRKTGFSCEKYGLDNCPASNPLSDTASWFTLEVANEEPAPLIAAELDSESVVPSLVSVSISPTASRLIVSNPLEKLVVTK